MEKFSHDQTDDGKEAKDAKEKRVRQYFLGSVIVKGLISFGEIVAGILVLIVPLSTMSGYLVKYANGEIAKDSGDFIATHLIVVAHAIVLVSSTFVALYLLTRGIIKLALIIALLKNKLWAYPISIAALCMLMAYQLYQILSSFSWAIVALTAFDLVVTISIWMEYKVLKNRASKS